MTLFWFVDSSGSLDWCLSSILEDAQTLSLYMLPVIRSLSFLMEIQLDLLNIFNILMSF